MSYTALYRKWRPTSFIDVKGQDHIVTTLKNQINADRIGHAYLFCGTRGTGKTTIAKIFAKAVNCEHPVDGNPCGECAVCKSIAAGTSMNVIEIDAASNNGVDNIREIRDEVAYSPTEGKYKVYIIDEVHMLSIGAFNALLKTLEEPPAYVIFILATTEAHKIPVTIMSRCQRYDFKRISVDTITDRLKELAEAENITVEDKALRYIAKSADGAMRDALSLFDQCIAFYMGKELKYENVLEVLGAVDTEIFSELLRKIINEDSIGSIRMLEDLIMQGRDLPQFVSDFTWYLRNLLMISASDDAVNYLDMSEENLKRLKEEAEMLDENSLMRYIRIFSELSGQIKFSSQKRVLIEVALIKLTKPQMETGYDSILERLKQLEDKVEKGITVVATPQIPTTPVNHTSEPVVSKQLERALPEDLKAVAANWQNIINKMDNSFKPHFREARITVDNEDSLLIVFENNFNYNFVNREEIINYVQDTIADTIDKSVPVRMKLMDTGTNFEDSFTDIENYVKMDIDVED